MKITLRAARVNKGFSQKKVAEEIGTTEYTISNWELGHTSIPAKFLIKMCSLYDVGIDNIILPE